MVVHKMIVTTSPDNRAVNIFYVTDNSEKLHERQRQEVLCEQVKDVLGDGDVHCKVIKAGPEWGRFTCSALFTAPHFICFDSHVENGYLKPLLEKASGITGSVMLDNSLSPAHTLLQISCKDRRGLFYDCTRTLREFQIQVAFGRVATNPKGHDDIDLFVLEADGSKILDPERQKLLCCRLEHEIVGPIKVMTRSRGPDTELLVATPIEASGRSRPRVMLDTTSVIRKLNLGIFQADLGRCNIVDHDWELCRFLLSDIPDLGSDALRTLLNEQVKQALLT